MSTHSDGNNVDPEVVERIVSMAEWDSFEKWDYSTTKSMSQEEEALAQAQRFVAAQSFLMSWQLGRVPTGWQRPRRLADFEEEYSTEVLEAALVAAERRIKERNESTTNRINKIRSLAKNPAAPRSPRPISKSEIEDLKDAYTKFSSDLYDIRAALANASATIAELTVRTQALAESSIDN